MIVRVASVLLGLSAALPAAAVELKPEEARKFVAGKLFAFSCFEGTRGAGRIMADGSVSGQIQLRGEGPTRFVRLPANTVRVQPTSVCASVKGIPFQPCFNVDKRDERSFRGSVSGIGFAYCDFQRRGSRVELSGARARPTRIRSASSVSAPAVSAAAPTTPVAAAPIPAATAPAPAAATPAPAAAQ